MNVRSSSTLQMSNKKPLIMNSRNAYHDTRPNTVMTYTQKKNETKIGYKPYETADY
jgi:hypothetical protein